MDREYGLHINGTEVKGNAGVEEAICPFSEKPWATVSQASGEDVGIAIDSAQQAFETWKKVPGVQRAKLLNRLADLIEEEADELSRLETFDNGKIRRETKSQMFFSARCYRFFAGMADKLVGETKPLDTIDAFDFTTREPMGVCALITPWNSPIAILTNKLAPCLAAGNTCVVKPSEFTSISTLYFADIVKRAGFPSGVFNVVVGKAEVGRALINSPRVNKISFTGSVEIGRMIAKQAGENVIPVTLELGGKSANIIMEDADLEKAIPGSVAGIFAASGQTCIAGSRLLVHRSVYDKVANGILERIKTIRFGDPQDMSTDIGPAAHRGQWEAIHRHIQKAQDDGAELLAGGRAASENIGGLFVAPTVFGSVDPASNLAQNEVFGPVLALIPFDSDEEAIKVANGTKYGLAAGIWTQNIRRAHQIARQMNAGQVWINTYRSSSAMAPFGGFAMSGYGKERGTEALLEYTRLKNVMIDLSDDVRDPFTIKM